MKIAEAIKQVKAVNISSTDIDEYEEDYGLKFNTTTHIDIAITYSKVCDLIRHLSYKYDDIDPLLEAITQHQELELLVKTYLHYKFFNSSTEYRINKYVKDNYNDIAMTITWVQKIKTNTGTEDTLLK